MKRADALYSSSQQPQHSGIYVVPPPPQAKPSELDEAKALIIAFFKELPEIALTLAAMMVLLVREAWRWLRQWKRIAKKENPASRRASGAEA